MDSVGKVDGSLEYFILYLNQKTAPTVCSDPCCEMCVFTSYMMHVLRMLTKASPTNSSDVLLLRHSSISRCKEFRKVPSPRGCDVIRNTLVFDTSVRDTRFCFTLRGAFVMMSRKTRLEDCPGVCSRSIATI